MIIAGIDPGKGGAIAFIETSTRSAVVIDMPVIDKEISASLLARLIRTHAPSLVYIEKVGYMPGDGGLGAFGFGKSTGIIYGIVGSMDISMHEFSPQKWKRHFGLLGKSKDASRELAIKAFPGLGESLKRKKDDGRAEALLIGLFGMGLVV